MSRISFVMLGEGGHDILRLALEAGRLPSDDLATTACLFFELSDDAGPLGFIGLEGAGADRLLRSLVVLAGRRRQGYGGLLVAHLEAFARKHGVERLHLLTQTVPDFFRARGYGVQTRAAAPTAIASTALFETLCGPSATYLVKDIA